MLGLIVVFFASRIFNPKLEIKTTEIQLIIQEAQYPGTTIISSSKDSFGSANVEIKYELKKTEASKQVISHYCQFFLKEKGWLPQRLEPEIWDFFGSCNRPAPTHANDLKRSYWDVAFCKGGNQVILLNVVERKTAYFIEVNGYFRASDPVNRCGGYDFISI